MTPCNLLQLQIAVPISTFCTGYRDLRDGVYDRGVYQGNAKQLRSFHAWSLTDSGSLFVARPIKCGTSIIRKRIGHPTILAAEVPNLDFFTLVAPHYQTTVNHCSTLLTIVKTIAVSGHPGSFCIRPLTIPAKQTP